jgi:hypothetical protein
LTLWFAVMAMLVATAPALASDATDTSHRILVMLKMPPNHYQPGSAYAGDYGTASTQIARNHIAARIASRHGFTLVNSWPMPLLGVDCFVMTVPESLTPEAAVEQVSHDADVAWSEPLQLYHARRAPCPTR